MNEDLKKDGESGIDEFKKAYNSIEIPENLRENVLKSIEKGRMEAEADQEIELKSKRTAGGHMIGRILLRTGQTAVAALIAITVLANSGATVAYAMGPPPCDRRNHQSGYFSHL